MATGQGVLERLKKAKAKGGRPGILPLIAFYGREPERERERNRMYAQIMQVMKMPDAEPDALPETPASRRNLLFIDLEDAVAIMDLNVSPIEYLVSEGEMETREDSDGIAGVRFSTAIRLRDLVAGVKNGGLRAPTLELIDRSTAGGAIPGYQIDCGKILARLRADMSEPWLFPMIESVVVEDDWLDLRHDGWLPNEQRRSWRSRRRKTITALHYGLDVAAVTLGHLMWHALDARWPDGAPEMPPVLRSRAALLR